MMFKLREKKASSGGSSLDTEEKTGVAATALSAAEQAKAALAEADKQAKLREEKARIARRQEREQSRKERERRSWGSCSC